MRYLIDTDIASYYLRGKFNLSDVFDNKGVDQIRLSVVSLSELEVLAFRNPQSKINLSSIALFAQKLGILNLDIRTWRMFSEMKASLLSVGKVRGDFDILIATIARRHGLIMVTNNVAHYDGLSVPVENWVSP